MSHVNQLYNKHFDTCKKNYYSENLNERDKIFLTLTSLKYLVTKSKNQSGLKKKLREKWKNHYGFK